MLRALLAAVLAVLLGATPAEAQTPAQVAERLAGDPVVVGGGMRDAVPAAAARRVRLRIAERAAGRIEVAVVSERSLAAAGGATAYANALAAAAVPRGALLVTSGTSWHVVTSHPDAAAASAALQRAVAGARAADPLPRRLLRAVDGLAAADPGPQADLRGGEAGTPGAAAAPDVDGFLSGLGTTLRWVLIGLAAAVGLPFVVVALVLLWRLAASHRGAALDHADRVDAARERLLALGEGVRELDEAGAPPEAAYGVLLDRYDAADLLLRGEPSPRTLRRAVRALGEAEAALATARAGAGAPAQDGVRLA